MREYRGKTLKSSAWIITILFAMLCLPSNGQESISELYGKVNPAKNVDDVNERITLHTEFLIEAVSQRDTQRIILGNLYLYSDYFVDSDFEKSMEYLIAAEQMTSMVNDTLVLGWINHKKGAIYSELKQNEKALEYYKQALELSKIASDSLFIAFSLEQIGRRYANLGNYESANAYYNEALPLIRRVCDTTTITTAYNNYGNTLDEQGKVEEAIELYKEGLVLAHQIEDPYEIAPLTLNLAYVYANNGRLEEASRLYHQSMTMSKQHQWKNYLLGNYEGLSLVHKKLGNADSSLYYFEKYHYLSDTVLGPDSQLKVAELQKQLDNTKIENELASVTDIAVLQKKQKKTILIVTSVVLGLLLLLLLYYLDKLRKRKRIIQENQRVLSNLEKILETRNTELQNLKSNSEKLNAKEEDREIIKLNLLDLRILTDNDWQCFKAIFDKSYPNYIRSLRIKFPEITEAEERLFTFIKLNLTTKESANILGVLPDTIKKTRSRLRKKLALDPNENLNEFISDFSSAN